MQHIITTSIKHPNTPAPQCAKTPQTPCAKSAQKHNPTIAQPIDYQSLIATTQKNKNAQFPTTFQPRHCRLPDNSKESTYLPLLQTNNMKKLITAFALVTSTLAQAQVTKNVIVEHFTNTFCSVCAARNPGFYTNLSNYPNVMHLSYYPSSPYAACPLSQHNKPQADARTNYYGIFGGTPRLVIQGKVIAASASYNSASLFTSELGQLTDFEMKVELKATSGSMLEVRTVIKKVATNSLTSLLLYGALVEDTLTFTAANGENKHYNVFRKSVWGDNPATIAAPTAVGDSVVHTQSLATNTTWNIARIYAIAMVQATDKEVIQASKSNKLGTSMSVPTPQTKIDIYPNPTSTQLIINGLPKGLYRAQIHNMSGQLVMDTYCHDAIDVNTLPTGHYTLRLYSDKELAVTRFTKQ